ncbi:MAG: hypothetical protein IKK57_05970 [Clostridia bacterium]|nr:hypothetical protein [Clostridia bacterium]
MFRNEYRRLQEGIHASEHLIHQTLNAAAPARHPAHSRLLPIAAVLVCLLVTLTLPRLSRPAALDITSENPASTPAPTFIPVGHETLADDMALRYQTSWSTAGERFIVLTLQGEDVSEVMNLRFALTSEKTGQTFWVGTQQLSHDPVRKLSTFVISFCESDLPEYTPIVLTSDTWTFPVEAYEPARFQMLPANDRLTLTLLDYTHILYEPLAEELPLDALPTDVGTVARTVDDSYHIPASLAEGPQILLDAASGLACEVFGSFTIRAGMNGNTLRVQTALPFHALRDNGSTELRAYIFLVPHTMTEHPWKSRGIDEGVAAPNALHIIRDKESEMEIRDYRYDIPTDAEHSPYGEGWMLCAVGFRTTDLPDNTCRLTFTLGD